MSADTPAETAPAPAPAEAPAPASETPEVSPAEQAAIDAHTATNAAEESWGAKIEGRLAAIEDHLGLNKEETS